MPRVYARRLAALQHEAALFVCVSEFVRDTLLARGFPPEKLEVIHQGVEIDTNPIVPAARQDEPYILFVGRFVEKKGAARPDRGDAAAWRRDGCDARLVLVGDGPLAETLRAQARGLDQVTFAGWLPNAEVRRLMRGAAAVCVPSVTARDGDAGGVADRDLRGDGRRRAGRRDPACRHSRGGRAWPHRAAGAARRSAGARRCARTALANPELRREFGAAARRVALERFSAIGQSRRLEAALLRAAGMAR